MEREPISSFSVVEGASGTLYVVIGNTPKGYDAIDLEKAAVHDEVRVTLPNNGSLEIADLKRVLPRFKNTYQALVDKYSRPEGVKT